MKGQEWQELCLKGGSCEKIKNPVMLDSDSSNGWLGSNSEQLCQQRLLEKLGKIFLKFSLTARLLFK